MSSVIGISGVELSCGGSRIEVKKAALGAMANNSSKTCCGGSGDEPVACTVGMSLVRFPFICWKMSVTVVGVT